MRYSRVILLIVFFIFSFFLFREINACDVFINASSQLPYTINQNNTYYCLNASSTNFADTAITFTSGTQNSTLDCQGYTLDGDNSGVDYGVSIYGSSTNNNTVKNCFIRDFYYGILLSSTSNNILINNIFDSSNTQTGIYLDSSSNNTLINNTANSNKYAIILSTSSNNTLINNTANSNINRGILLYSGSNNIITGGSIANNGQDYHLQSTGTTNNFTNTNFTSTRTIYFYDTTSWFNYNNETTGNIWLKTEVSVQANITRKLILWTQSLMQWNDTNSSGTGITANYNITGLNANKYYNVYNNSILAYTLQTDSSGNLPSFTIYLSSEHEIKVQEDNTPQWSNNITSPASLTTYSSGQTYIFNLSVTDDNGVSKVILEFNYTNYTDVTNEGNVYYKTLTDLPANPTGYPFKWYMNDSANNWNVSDQWTYVVNKITPNPVNLYLNDTPNANRTYTYPEMVNLTATAVYSGSGTLFLYTSPEPYTQEFEEVNGTDSIEIVGLPLGAGNVAFKINTTGNENYTSNETGVKYYMTVNAGDPSSYINLYIDGEANNKTITYPETVEIIGNISTIPGADDLTFDLHRNDEYITSGNSTEQIIGSTQLGNSTHTFVYNTTGGANWGSGSSATRILYVLKGPTEIAVYLNGTRDNKTYVNNTAANFTVALNVSGKNVNLTMNISGWVNLTGLTPLMNYTTLTATGVYNITGYWEGDANYTSDSETWYATAATTTTSTSTSTTTTIGGGGGGGGIKEHKKTNIWTKMTPGSAEIMHIDDPEIGLKQITIIVRNPAQTVTITVTKLVGQPASVVHNITGKVYKYVEITPTNIPDDNINSTKIQFQVEKSWMTSNNINKATIALNRYKNNVWQRLTTRVIGEDSTYVNYEADSPGFSTFAITGGEIVTTIPTTIATTSIMATTVATTMVTTIPLPEIIGIQSWTIGLMVIIICVVVLVWVFKKTGPKSKETAK